MGNQSSSDHSPSGQRQHDRENDYDSSAAATRPTQRKTFPGSALLDGTVMLCGVDTTTHSVDQLCSTTPTNADDDIVIQESRTNPTSALFARALVSEVTDNPNTMTPAKMAEREKKLLKAQNAAKKSKGSKAVGAPGGVGQPSLMGSIAHVLGGTAPEESMIPGAALQNHKKTVEPPNSLSENRAQAVGRAVESHVSKHRITVGLSLSRRHSTVGHPDTVTRQTVFDFNELQDREYKYVSSTDATGWRAGGGERGGRSVQPSPSPVGFDEESDYYQQQHSAPAPLQTHKVAAPDTVHIPIIHIDAESPEAVDAIISALARGEVFIPHMAVLPEALSVNGISPPDLVVRFGCERNDDAPPDEWPNWCLEFMHNQLYEYFHSMGARWMKRPFQITLAKKVRWKTVKHMNRYFAHAERVLDAWREKGPQYLDPQLSYIEGGATPEEVARPHGIYLIRNGVPTNYFAPNFDPPYTTKMTRSLLTNVLDKSWDKKRREWTSEPVPRLVTPATLVGALCGCADPAQGGFLANQVTHEGAVQDTIVDTGALTLDDDSQLEDEPSVVTSFLPPKKAEPKTTPKRNELPFQLHPLDTSRSPSGGHTAFVSAEDTISTPTAARSPDSNKGTNVHRPRESAISSRARESPPSNRSTPSSSYGPDHERERDNGSEVAQSAVTVQRVNTSNPKPSPKVSTWVDVMPIAVVDPFFLITVYRFLRRQVRPATKRRGLRLRKNAMRTQMSTSPGAHQRKGRTRSLDQLLPNRRRQITRRRRVTHPYLAMLCRPNRLTATRCSEQIPIFP